MDRPAFAIPEERFGAVFAPYLGHKGDLRLNLGCGRMTWPTWANIDQYAAPDIDYLCDLERATLPFDSNSAVVIVACHVLEHIRNLVPLMRECHRVLKPAGYMIAVTPYASSDDAWEDPTHVRAFSQKSWMYFNQRTYSGRGHAGCYDSEVDFTFEEVCTLLIPMPEWAEQAKTDPKQLAWELRTYRNVVQEMRTVLRKVAL
jgi:SAM-dependent methyltransferase